MEGQQVIQPRPKTMNPHAVPSRLRRQGFSEMLAFGLVSSVLMLLVATMALSGKNLSAQTYASQVTNPSASQPVPEAIATRSPVPGLTVEQPPGQMRVSWDSHGLEIEASNASLNQILRQVAAYTGARLEGLTQDQRVFGSYGPGPGCDVLSKLLDGSGYNVLIIGNRDTGLPLEIVLSVRLHVSPQTTNNHKDDEADRHVEPKPQPDQQSGSQDTQQAANPFNIGGPPRDPQQLMEEILQRQQKIDQEQQNQQNNPPK